MTPDLLLQALGAAPRPPRELAIGLSVALGAGLLVGLERERRKGRGADRGAAGIRTFTLAALAGALALGLGQPLLVLAGALAVAALAVNAYRGSLRRGAGDRDPGLTTELALVVTYLVGVLAMQQPALGAAAGVVLAALLASRERLHRFATQALSEAELHDALLLAALALVVLPLLSADPQPWSAGIAPRTVGAVLVLILVLQGAGHVATRVVGLRAGLALSGFLSGFVSSTATIASMGARARQAPGSMQACEAGAVLSTAATWLQALVMVAALSPSALPRLLPAALAAAAVAVAWGVLRARGAAPVADGTAADGDRHGTTADGDRGRTKADRDRGPLRLREAAIVALLLAAVTAGVAWAQARFGAGGAFAGVAIGALADAHASIAALATLHAGAQLTEDVLLRGVLVAVATNAVVRGVTAVVAGGPRFGARVAASLAASTAAAAALVAVA